MAKSASIPIINQEELLILIRTAYYRACSLYRVYQNEDAFRLMRDLDHIYQNLLLQEKQRRKVTPKKETHVLHFDLWL